MLVFFCDNLIMQGHQNDVMGLIPHTKIRVNKIAPMGDPMELFLRGYTLTLRKEDAHNITIEEDAE